VIGLPIWRSCRSLNRASPSSKLGISKVSEWGEERERSRLSTLCHTYQSYNSLAEDSVYSRMIKTTLNNTIELLPRRSKQLPTRTSSTPQNTILPHSTSTSLQRSNTMDDTRLTEVVTNEAKIIDSINEDFPSDFASFQHLSLLSTLSARHRPRLPTR